MCIECDKFASRIRELFERAGVTRYTETLSAMTDGFITTSVEALAALYPNHPELEGGGWIPLIRAMLAAANLALDHRAAIEADPARKAAIEAAHVQERKIYEAQRDERSAILAMTHLKARVDESLREAQMVNDAMS